ncbi:MAG TPA: 50S ribosome-binding GTPase, partial [Actinomycetota bacterium]|nr:50S ribosome-binding GTPase [Actinomycetota bacterium]
MPGDEVYSDDLADETDLEALAQAAAALAEQEYADEDVLEPGEPPLPVVAVIGRPNVGKSTLVNRILGRREAVVQDVPGVTRDRVRYTAEWSGREFQLIDTGGWEVDATGMRADIAAQAERAVDEADVVVFVVDAKVGTTDSDEQVVPILRKSGKPVLLVANKVDDVGTESDAASLWSLGLG